MELLLQIVLYGVAWLILDFGITRGENLRMLLPSFVGFSLVDVGVGVGVSILAVVISIIIFLFLAVESFTVLNFLGIFGTIFGVGTGFYALYKIPSRKN